MGRPRDFAQTRSDYTEQVLDGIQALRLEHPFAAVTLACCAIDMLSHVLHNPPPNNTGPAFEKTVNRRLQGYRDFGDAVLQLRNGLVHEFQTGSNGINVHLSGEFPETVLPTRDHDDVVVSIHHFLSAVLAMYEDFFERADETLKREFVDRAFIHAVELPPRLITGMVAASAPNFSTWVVGASSTAGALRVNTFNPDLPNG